MDLSAERVFLFELERFAKPGKRTEEITFGNQAISIGHVLAHEPGAAFGGAALGGLGVLLGPLPFALDAIDGDRRADENDEQEDRAREQGRGQGGFAAAPAPEPHRSADGPRAHWLV